MTAKVQPAGFCTMLLAPTVVWVLVRVLLPATSACKEAPALRTGQAKALAFGLPDRWMFACGRHCLMNEPLLHMRSVPVTLRLYI